MVEGGWLRVAAILHDSHVAGNDGGDIGLACGIDDLAHVVEVFLIDNGVDGEVALHAVRLTGLCNLAQVVDGEGRG